MGTSPSLRLAEPESAAVASDHRTFGCWLQLAFGADRNSLIKVYDSSPFPVSLTPLTPFSSTSRLLSHCPSALLLDQFAAPYSLNTPSVNVVVELRNNSLLHPRLATASVLQWVLHSYKTDELTASEAPPLLFKQS